MMHKEAVERREDQHHAQEHAVQNMIEPAEIPVLDLVEDQKSVMLPYDVIVSPHSHNEGEITLPPEQHHHRSQREKESNAAEEQQAPGPPCLAIEKRPARHAEYMCPIEPDRPEPPQKRDGHVEHQVHQQIDISGYGAADHEEEIDSGTDDPAAGDPALRARNSLGDRCQVHSLASQDLPLSGPKSICQNRRGAWVALADSG